MNRVYYVNVTVRCFDGKSFVDKVVDMPSSTLSVNTLKKRLYSMEYISKVLYGKPMSKLPKSKSFNVIKVEFVKELKHKTKKQR